MAHTSLHKSKLLNRIRRLQGQLNAVAQAFEGEHDCGSVLLTLAACRGAMNSLMAEILEGHVRHHLLPENDLPPEERSQAADELIQVLKRHLR